MNQMAVGNGMKNIITLIPNVGSKEAASAEEITQHSVLGGRTCICERYGTRYAQRERERGTKRYNSIHKNATVTNEQ